IEHNIFDDFFTGAGDPGADQVIDEANFEVKLAPYSLEFAIDEAEAKFKADADRDPHESLSKIKLGDDITIEATEGLTARSVAQKESGIRVSSAPPISPQVAYGAELSVEQDQYRMEVFLTRPILPGPARLTLHDAAPLVLDPRNRMFYAKGSLVVFE